MLTSIQISNFRGIASGAPLKLAPLTILLGPNGSGKSAILDALLIGSSPKPGEAVGRAVSRHGLKDSARWLIRRAEPDTEARIDISVSGAARRTMLRFSDENHIGVQNHPGPYGTVEVHVSDVDRGPEGVLATGKVHFAYDDFSVPEDLSVASGFSRPVRLIDSFQPYDAGTLAHNYDTLLNAGSADSINALLAKLVPNGRELRVGVDAALHPTLKVLFEGNRGAVPLGLAGDGVKLAVRASMELAASHDGVVLFEEPDAHLHPAAIWLVAKAMVEAVRGGVQVILSTHSLELVDALIAESVDDLSRLAVLRTRLQEGELVTSRTAGEDARHARVDMEEDLR
jgi:energy-coupling factor transporter ATP-binding protein EcfA2